MKFGLRHMRYFLAVAEELHFRRAADRLGIAQPALSRAIQHLEAELGVVLFERSNRNVRLTPAGQEFLDGTHGILNAVDHTVENTRQVHAGGIGTIRVGYTDFAIAGTLPSLLQTFRGKQPGITLQPHHDVTTLQLEKLAAGVLDIGFVTGPVSKPDYEQIEIQQDQLVCIVHENHRLANRQSVRLDELANEDFIHGPPREWEHFYAHLMPLCRSAGFIPRIVQEAFNSAGILGLVASGMGITILTESSLIAARRGLIPIPIETTAEPLSTLAIWNPQSLSGSVARFTEFLQARMAQA
ncbi:LysR family transcriptional regulator [Litoreibacter roseus]|uniref:Transcriptional regulator n=1 Tax=Litoreibacter roseus TaxID=2601869 RepID=A0A6N6JE85_9RHOB|nr:LysR family transcriptional regulator [Litoreibacter roseus]GFE64663.1 transcriptional regulator [Litoreibacter roseus]